MNDLIQNSFLDLKWGGTEKGVEHLALMTDREKWSPPPFNSTAEWLLSLSCSRGQNPRLRVSALVLRSANPSQSVLKSPARQQLHSALSPSEPCSLFILSPVQQEPPIRVSSRHSCGFFSSSFLLDLKLWIFTRGSKEVLLRLYLSSSEYTTNWRQLLHL